MKFISEPKKKLIKNTILLYILQFSSQFLALITIPYQTRVLGPEIYGTLGFVISIMTYVQLVLDFGFLLSATAEVSLNRDNKQYINQIYTIVFVSKIVLAIVLAIPISFLGITLERLNHDWLLLYLYYVAYVANALSPDYFYRGIENMKVITIRTISIKAIFTVLIFIFLKGPEDYYAVPILTLMGNLIALITILVYTHKRYNVRWCLVPYSLVKQLIAETIPFFFSRIASTVYTATNTFILGIYYPSGPVLGYYTSTDKLISTVKGIASPVADSLYPYMTKQKDFKLIKRILLLLFPLLLIGAAIALIFAHPICILLFGDEYYEAGTLLRLLLPAAFVIFPSYILAFPTLNPMGLSKYANRSNIYGACFQILGLAVLFVCNAISVYSICVLTSCTEVLVFLYRVMVIYFYRKRKRL